jgi:hypothetical protein
MTQGSESGAAHALEIGTLVILRCCAHGLGQMICTTCARQHCSKVEGSRVLRVPLFCKYPYSRPPALSQTGGESTTHAQRCMLLKRQQAPCRCAAGAKHYAQVIHDVRPPCCTPLLQRASAARAQSDCTAEPTSAHAMQQTPCPRAIAPHAPHAPGLAWLGLAWLGLAWLGLAGP